MAREILTAGQVSVPHEVIVHKRNGKQFRALITGHSLDNEFPGYDLNAIGVNANTRQKISLKFNTEVKLGRPVTEQQIQNY